MADNVVFSSTRLVGTGKAGKLTPDADGYYTMVIGGLNVFNSTNEYYTLKGAEELFNSSSIFMRRVQNGSLRGEVGHPQKLPNQSVDDFIHRNLRIDPENTCAHFKEIWLDKDFGKKNPKFNNPNLVAIMAKIKPSGAKGAFLKEALENGSENVCFSIRALTKDYFKAGVRNRVLVQIVTFDYVNEPGIMIANKWDSPALEEADKLSMVPESLLRILRGQEILATEDSSVLATDTAKRISTNMDLKNQTKPTFMKW